MLMPDTIALKPRLEMPALEAAACGRCFNDSLFEGYVHCGTIHWWLIRVACPFTGGGGGEKLDILAGWRMARG